MAGYQFAHVQTYSRRGNGKNRSARSVAQENDRLDGHAPHVPEPQPPRVLFGMSAMAAVDLIEAAVEAQARLAKGRGKGIRQDTHVLSTVVLSHPVRTSELDQHDITQRYESWRDDAVQWLQRDAERRGLRLLSVIEHTDEAHPHLHALLMPEPGIEPRMNAKTSHPGHVAAKAVAVDTAGLAAKEAAKLQSEAYRKAMREWQDAYYIECASRHGMSRLGPGRRRLSRAEWQAEQAQAEALMHAQAAALQLEQSAVKVLAEAQQQAREVVTGARKEAGVILAQSSTLKSRLEQSEAVMSDQQRLIERLTDEVCSLRASSDSRFSPR